MWVWNGNIDIWGAYYVYSYVLDYYTFFTSMGYKCLMKNKGIDVKRETFEWQYCETCFYSCTCLPLEYNRFRHIEHVWGLHITLVFIQN